MAIACGAGQPFTPILHHVLRSLTSPWWLSMLHFVLIRFVAVILFDKAAVGKHRATFNASGRILHSTLQHISNVSVAPVALAERHTW